VTPVDNRPIELPPTLRAAVSNDLRPVTPLQRPARRVLSLVPIAIMLLFGAMFVFGLRRDAPQLGFALTWGASVLQAMLGLVLVAAALREAVPGTTLGPRTLAAAFATAAVAVLALTWITWTTTSTTFAPPFSGFVWRVCTAGTVVSALPALAASAWLVARAFPLRPRIAGALYGLGAGLMADAGWRLFCHFPDPLHILSAHVLGVVVAALLGIGVARILTRS
jgi:hypothetical protein